MTRKKKNGCRIIVQYKNNNDNIMNPKILMKIDRFKKHLFPNNSAFISKTPIPNKTIVQSTLQLYKVQFCIFNSIQLKINK